MRKALCVHLLLVRGEYRSLASGDDVGHAGKNYGRRHQQKAIEKDSF